MLGSPTEQVEKEVPDWTKADFHALKLALEEANWLEEFVNTKRVE